jgi:hypothetical protein
VLQKLRKSRDDAFFRLIVDFHYIRLWKNMNLGHKVVNLHLLKKLLKLPAMKKAYLI